LHKNLLKGILGASQSVSQSVIEKYYGNCKWTTKNGVTRSSYSFLHDTV